MRSQANGRARTVTQGFFGLSRFAVPVGSRPGSWLRDALAALPEPWTVLASRRRSGLDGPPWVRYVVLHPAKGIALVDVDPTEPAVAPLEDFFDHTGLGAFQSEALPIVAVTLPRDGGVVVAEAIEAAFAESFCQLGNPYWCEATVELLLTTPELSLARLRRTAPLASIPGRPSAVLVDTAGTSELLASPAPPAHIDVPVLSEIQSEAPLSDEPVMTPSLAPVLRADEPTANAGWLLGSQSEPPRRTWRSWSILPVTATATLLAVVTLLLASPPASPPNETAAAPKATQSLTVAAVSPPSTAGRAAPAVNPASKPASAEIPPPSPPSSRSKAAAPAVSPATPTVRAAPRNVARQRPVEHAEHYAWHHGPSTAPAPREQRMAVASTAAPTSDSVCADVLHPDRPGGWKYHGPPVSGCLPIRFFGFIGMR